MKLQAPIRVQVQVHIESDDATGIATLNLPYGKYPTEDDGEGGSSRIHFAMPGGDDFED
jgi:hypothetical protein